MATTRVTNRQKNPGSTDGYLAASSGIEVVVKSNFTATTAPSGGNDTTQGYAQGSLWYDTSAKRIYICENNASGSAIWKSLGTTVIGQLSTTGTAGTDTFLRGDASWNNALTGALTLGTKLGFSSTTTVTNGNKEILSLSGGFGYNVATGGTHAFSINGTAVSTLAAASWTLATTNGILMTSATGSVTAATRGITPTSAGIVINVPTGGSVIDAINGSSISTLTAATLSLATTSGIAFTSSTGSVTAGTRGIIPTSNGLEYNTPSATTHVFKINNVEVGRFDSRGLTVVNDPQDWFMWTQNYYR